MGSFALALSSLLALLKKLSNSGKEQEDAVIKLLLLLGGYDDAVTEELCRGSLKGCDG